MSDGVVAIIGGPEVFGMFLPRYDAFHLSRAAEARLPGGRPVFPQVPERTPEELLRSHGLRPGSQRIARRRAGRHADDVGALIIELIAASNESIDESAVT